MILANKKVFCISTISMETLRFLPKDRKLQDEYLRHNEKQVFDASLNLMNNKIRVSVNLKLGIYIVHITDVNNKHPQKIIIK